MSQDRRKDVVNMVVNMSQIYCPLDAGQSGGDPVDDGELWG
jgi:hypothetical protein